MTGVPAVRMRGITKRFGSVQALRGADFSLAAGEIRALLGENGAGKSTLMHVLFGLQALEGGIVEMDGVPVSIESPRAAMDLGIGMVHQHFTQVARFSVAENVWLGRPGVRTDMVAARAAVLRVGEATGLRLDPQALAGDLPVGLRQRLEIVKALARDVRVLVLDEPTAALTPQETTDLFAALRRLRAAGVAVAFITHKLRDAIAIADRVTVLRQGAVVLAAPTADVTVESLAAAMIGESDAADLMATVAPTATIAADADAGGGREAAVIVDGLRVRSEGRVVVRDVSLRISAGEIVGVAAVEGNGQRELLRAIAGLMPCEGGVVVAGGGVAGFIPEDRQHEGLLLDLDIAENLALGRLGGFWLRPRQLAAEAERAVADFGIQGAAPDRPVRALSGGNQQKVVLARALAARPRLLVAENPTRGLDVHAMADVHARLRRAAHADGLGVLFHSTDLDEVLSLADRVGVMVNGSWREASGVARTREAVGALMLGTAA